MRLAQVGSHPDLSSLRHCIVLAFGYNHLGVSFTPIAHCGSHLDTTCLLWDIIKTACHIWCFWPQSREWWTAR